MLCTLGVSLLILQFAWSMVRFDFNHSFFQALSLLIPAGHGPKCLCTCAVHCSRLCPHCCMCRSFPRFCSILLCLYCFFEIGKQVKSAMLTVKPALGQPVLIPFTYCDAADWPYDGVLLFRLCNFGLSMLMIAAALFSVICVVRIALC